MGIYAAKCWAKKGKTHSGSLLSAVDRTYTQKYKQGELFSHLSTSSRRARALSRFISLRSFALERLQFYRREIEFISLGNYFIRQP
jgi:hypothetical protein